MIYKVIQQEQWLLKNLTVRETEALIKKGASSQLKSCTEEIIKDPDTKAFRTRPYLKNLVHK